MIDEVANGLSFFEATFLSELPRLYGALEDQLAARDTARSPGSSCRPSCGSAAGSAATATATPSSPQGCSTGARHAVPGAGLYLDELHKLGSQLSLASLLVSPSEALMALAERSPDTSRTAATSPTGAPSRASMHGSRRPAGCCSARRRRATGGRGRALRRRRGARRRSRDRARSLESNGSGPLARGRLRRLRRAVAVFGFHLAPVDLRQNADVPEQVVAELLAVARPGGLAPGARRGGAHRALLEEIASPRPLYSPYVTYSELSTGELAILRMAREAHQRYGTDSVPNCIISKTDGVSDMLELALLLKETGLLDPRAATLAT